MYIIADSVYVQGPYSCNFFLSNGLSSPLSRSTWVMRVRILGTCIPVLIEHWYPSFSCIINPALGAVGVPVLRVRLEGILRRWVVMKFLLHKSRMGIHFGCRYRHTVKGGWKNSLKNTIRPPRKWNMRSCTLKRHPIVGQVCSSIMPVRLYKKSEDILHCPGNYIL